jgi:hypothetical protein
LKILALGNSFLNRILIALEMKGRMIKGTASNSKASAQEKKQSTE